MTESSIQQLNEKGSNFHKWRETVEVEVANIGARRVLDPNFQAVCRADVTDQDKAWGVITKMIDERIRYLFQGHKTPSAILAKAEELYGSKDPVRYRQRLEDLSQFKFVGGSVEGHLAEVRGMIASLRSYTSDPILPAQELNLLAETLPESFDDIKTRIISEEFTSWDQAAKLIRAKASLHPSPETPAPSVGPTGGVALAVTSTVTVTHTDVDRATLRLTTAQKRELASRLAEQGTPICTICFVLGHFAEGHVPSRNAANNAAQRAAPAPNGNAGTRVAAAATLTNQPSATNPDVETLSRALESSLYF